MRRHPSFGALAGAAALLAFALAACAGAPRSARLPTPPDPPPVPARKPAPESARAMAQTGFQTGLRAEVQAAAITAPATPAAARATGRARAGAGAAAPATVVAYRVQAGDTVFGVARRLGVPLRSVIEANALRPPYVLAVGQVLRIPNPRRHVVQAGDTVYGVSRRYGVDMSELVRLNAIRAPYTISPGEDLILPVWTRSTPPAAPAPTRAPAAGPVQTAAGPRAPAVPVPAPAAEVQRARLVAIPRPPPRSSGKFLWPVQGNLVAGYGPKAGGLHNDGINIAAPRGTPVRAAENGVVVYIGNELRGFGNLVLIKHAEGWVTAYAHTDGFLVRRGQVVKRGQPIARVGSTGNVSKPQLHFEIRKGTRAVDPARLLG